MYRYLACALAMTAATIAVTPGLAAQAKPKAPADAPKTYTVQFVFDETTYCGHDDAERGQRRRVRTDGH